MEKKPYLLIGYYWVLVLWVIFVIVQEFYSWFCYFMLVSEFNVSKKLKTWVWDDSKLGRAAILLFCHSRIFLVGFQMPMKLCGLQKYSKPSFRKMCNFFYFYFYFYHPSQYLDCGYIVIFLVDGDKNFRSFISCRFCN